MSGQAVLAHHGAQNLGALARFEDLIRQAEALGVDLEFDEIPEALGSLERVRARLTFRAFAVAEPTDRLLDVKEAAELLGRSEDALYRKASSYPFTVREGRGVWFSKLGIEKYIRARQGRG